MLERLGKVCGWAGTGLALLIVVWAFLTWSPGNGGPFYFGVLAAVVVFLIGQALRYVLLASNLTDNFRNPVGFVSGAKIIRATYPRPMSALCQKLRSSALSYLLARVQKP